MSIKNDDVAVIGMAGRFPGANSVSEFWDNLCAGRGSIRTLSDDELRQAGVSERDIADPNYVKAGAWLDDVDQFDRAFFKISRLEAELMDPQVRLLLQCAWETLEDAGRATRDAQRIGVFAGAGGVTTNYLSNVLDLDDRFDRFTASAVHLGNDKDFLATYLSYKLNLTGPSMTVQSACSTSLVALHQARLSLLNGECDMALAGGVTVRVPHRQGYAYKEGYIFSKTGRIRSFDADADGVVFGSGLGMVLIKRLADALRDGDPIHAVLKGSALVNDGKLKLSYAASSAKGQVACVRAALQDAGVDAGSIGYVEAHGTGTAMGDPEEVKALSQAFKEHAGRKGDCVLGAVKTNVGHLEAAAGIAGFIKVVLAVKHGLIPPTLHYTRPNQRINFDNSPFVVDAALRTWREVKRPRRAAVNSLGVGGTNAFAIVEQHMAAKVTGRKPSGPFVVPVSAKTPEALQAYLGRLAAFVDAAIDAAPAGRKVGRKVGLELAELAHTLQTGREAMAVRRVFVVDTLDALQRALSASLQGEAAAVSAPMADGVPAAVAALAAAWASGQDVDWATLQTGPTPRRIHLPTTVFAKERCWIDQPARTAVAPAPAALHPLLHANTSDLNEQRYSASFSGDEFFLRDHRLRLQAGAVEGDAAPKKVLPGVAYLEMARAAVEQAAPPHHAAGALSLRDVVWLQPLTVDGEATTAVNIALVRDAGSAGAIDFEVYTADDRIHCQGRAAFADAPAPEAVDTAALQAAMRRRQWTAGEVYAAFSGMGVDYGPSHRTVASIAQGDRQLLAQLVLDPSVAAGAERFVLHPGLMDGALQAATTLLFEDRPLPRQPIVPFALGSLRVLAPCGAFPQVWARHAEGSRPGDKAALLDIDLLDDTGQVCVQMRGFSARPVGRETLGSLLATQDWEPTAAEAAPAPPAVETHLIVCDLPPVGDCTAIALDARLDEAARYAELALACFAKAQAVLQSRPQGRVLLQLALPDDAAHAIHAGLSGLFKTLRLENPQLAGQIVFVPPGIGADALSALLQAERGRAHDTLVRHAAGGRERAHWRFLSGEADEAFADGGPFKAHGIYLITGGLGGLGRTFANEILASAPQATLVLTGRASMTELAQSPERLAQLAALQQGGAKVEYRQLDLEDAGQVEQLVAAVRAAHGALNGVLHAAGMTADGFVLKKTADEFRRVLGPKTAGTVHLDLATRDVDLDFLVLFSSLSAAVGNIGQADYAAANGFLDAFSAQRNQLVAQGHRRGHTVAIRWPLWQEGGMQPDAAARQMLVETTGTYAMPTGTGMRMFRRSLALGLDQTLVMDGDLSLMRRSLGVGQPLHAAEPALPAVLSAALPAVLPVDDAAGSLAAQAERFLCTQMAALLKIAPERLDPAAPLEDHGIDSILALDLTRLLEKSFGALPKTLFFEYLTVRELAGYFVSAHAATLATLFAASASPATATPAAVAPDSPAARLSIRTATRRVADEAAAEPIAIVGLSGRYAESPDLDAFWRNLRDGRDCITEVPATRWDWREYYSENRDETGRHFSKWGGFIEGVDEFDARFFNISPLEAETIDPQERLFLQHAWMALEDAGCTRAALQIPHPGDLPAQVGVYAGVMYGEYQLFGAEASLKGRRIGFASNPSSIANRVSYVLNLHGPSLSVDTMCSSSLTAIHLACQDLRAGRTALGIAGGVNVTIHPNKYLMLSAGHFISGDGHCQSFGEGGDGYIPGEGVGVVVLKRLSQALRDGNRIHGVIRGSALSHGGKTNGYTVPNPQAQASAIRQAFAEARVNPRHVSYIEAHGTGTKLGDPIEIAALAKVFQEQTADTGFCLLGSAKSNIGHAEAAAGIAGLTKVLLQLRHRQIVPSLHSSRLNPHIDFAATPFVVNQALRPWDAPMVDGRQLPRIAGISSFGAGGSNAHLVIEEHVPAAAPLPAAGPHAGPQMVPLSARTAEQLRQKASDLVAYLEGVEVPPLASIAFTLQVGREAMDHRLALLADSPTALAAQLRAWLDGRPAAGVFTAQAKEQRDALALRTQGADWPATLARWMAARQLDALAELWTQGLVIDWAALHAVRPPLVGLPAYPFARQRHWIDLSALPEPAAHAEKRLHPLVHRNTSDADGLRYTSQFEGGFLLDEDRCVEMARAAIGLALPRAEGVLQLRELGWAQPMPALDGQPVSVSLFDVVGTALAFEVHSPAADGSGERVLCQGRAAFGVEAIANAASPPAAAAALPAAAVPVRLPVHSSVHDIAAAPLDKPKRIALAAAAGIVATAVPGKPRTALASPGTLVQSVVDTGLALHDHGDGVLVLRLDGATGELADALADALRTVASIGTARVLLIDGASSGFFGGSRQRAIESGLYRAVTELPLPVIAVVRGAATGAGLMLAAVCDFMVCDEAARLSAGDVPPSTLHGLLSERFGAAPANELLYFSRGGLQADALSTRGPGFPVHPSERLSAAAFALARELADKSPISLRLLKRHLARRFAAALQTVQTVQTVPPGAAPMALRPLAVPAASQRLSWTLYPGPVLQATLRAPDAPDALDAIDELRAAFAQLDGTDCRAIVLASDSPDFLPALAPSEAAAWVELMSGLATPLITAVPGTPRGLGLLVAQLGDACVCAGEPEPEIAGWPIAATLAGEPIGLREVVAPDDVIARALALAAALAELPASDTAAWKRCEQPTRQARAALLRTALLSSGEEGAEEGAEQGAEATGPLALDSTVISARRHAGGVLEVRMAERDAKNMFSPALSQGLREVFARIADDTTVRVVVLTGYDNYFASGGTPDTLRAIHEGRAKFTDDLAFQLPLACPVPVVAAMQGHGIGAGWAMGMHADFALFSDESRYVSPYMGYGFTPGAGSTQVFPARIGHDLARETLMTARELSGGALKARGLRLPVLPREQVLPQALRLAAGLASLGRARLVALKQAGAGAARAALSDTFERELAMHAATFVGQTDTLARIEGRFGAEPAPVASAAAAAAATGAGAAVAASADLSSLAASLREMLANELRMPEDEIGYDEQFVDLGLDSITGVTWIRRINETFGTALEAIQVYSHPTLALLARFVQQQMPASAALAAAVEASVVSPVAAPATAPTSGVLGSWRTGQSLPTAATARTTGLQPIAVIGMAGRFAMADNLDQFWRNLADGRDCITEVPDARWDLGAYFSPGDPTPGKTYSRWMGALDGHDLFDAAFFNVSPREARAMDPQQRVFLQACWHAIEHAGHDPKSLGGSRCGVFVGASMGDYHQRSRRDQLSGQGFTGAAPSILAARIAYVLDLHGPALSIDTACSSSLVAIASACDSLVLGGSDLALAGGVNVMAGPAMQIMTSQVGMLSPGGRCFSFDARADGIVNGEGVGVVLLKRLADAQRDGDEVHGVIEAWGVNQDGRTNGITAPNAQAQARLQLEVWQRFGIDPAGIQLIEAHGTGTALGDPIEVAGLKASFSRHTQQQGFCALGSVKSSIGHCLTAAGISGTLKLLLALKHEQLPPTVHFERLNPHIQLQGSPFHVNDRLRPWTVAAGQRRRGAVNSFGFSGTNAHLVIAQAPGAAPRHAAAPMPMPMPMPVLVPLSAKTPAQLLQLAQDLLAFVRSGRALELDRIAFTLQVGREAMAERAAFVARDAAELERQLQAFVGRGVPLAHTGAVKSASAAMATDPDFQALLAKWIARGELPRVAELWTQGLAIDWGALHKGAAQPRRIGLPVLYPFAKDRHWLDADVADVAEASPGGLAPTPVHALAAETVAWPQAGVAIPPAVPTAPVALVVQADAKLQAEIRESLAEALFMQPSDIGIERSFHELGLDSIIGVEWVKALNKRHGTQISAARVYDHPNVKALALYIAGLTRAATPATVAAARVATPVAASVPVPPARPLQELQAEIRDSLAEALFMQPSDIGLDKSFHELGLDSIIGVEWVKALNKRHGTQIAATRVYDHPTVRALAAHLSELIAPRRPVELAYFHGAVAEGDLQRDGELSLRLSVSPETHVGLNEHVVFGRHLMPTDAWIELIWAAWRAHVGGTPVAFEHLVFGNPLIGTPGRPTALRLTFRRQAAGLQCFVRSGPDAEQELLHLQGLLVPASPVATVQPSSFAVERELAAGEITTNAGRHYAPLRSLQLAATAARGEIRTAEHGFAFALNPFALYGGLCTVINHARFLAERAHGASDDQFLPYRIGRLTVLGEFAGRDFSCHAELLSQSREAMDFRLVLLDAQERPVLAIESIQLRRVARAAIAPQDVPTPQSVGAPQAPRAVEPIAIIGMAGRYPRSENVEDFWDHLKAGRDCVTEVPAGRWGAESDWYHPDPRHPRTSYSKWGGFLDRIDTFDALFFGISPAEAELIDPQQRIFLEECWKAIESAGQAPGALSGRACGVYVGCGSGDYTRVLAAEGHDTAGAAFMGNSSAILAARIAYHLNLKGPALAIDTACSSSLVAVHLACESIRHGENELALAGGINLLATPIGHILTSQVGMPSRDGRSATFDAAADGIVFSEGCGVVLLKSLSAAERDGDPILGVIAGSGINQDGKTNGITAPSSIAQAQLLRQVYDRFGIDTARIGYVEAHGTATPLGDPIEVNALGEVFGVPVDGRKTCALGSVKSNIGHTGFAAGIAGMIKVLLCLKHRQLVPSIHYRLANPHIAFEQTPFHVNTELRDWESEQPRMAAVSSFGFSGTNAHVVIAEHVPSRPAAGGTPDRPALVPLSAKTEDQLLLQVRQLLRHLQHLQHRPEAVPLARIAHTLQVGRDAMEHRLAVIAGSLDELQQALQAVADGRGRVAGVHRGRASLAGDTLAAFAADDEMRQLVQRWVAQKNLAKVADLWVKGFELDLGPLHGGEGLQRLALPTYPFAQERCWVDPSGQGAAFGKTGGRLAPLHPLLHPPLHPLLHRNVSDLGEQGYASRFSGDEFFLDDHRVNGQRVLPAVAYLEMARAALLDAIPGDAAGRQVEFGDVAWPQPLVATGPCEVGLAVFGEDDGRLGFEVWTVGDDGSERLHCQGRGRVTEAPGPQSLDLPALRAAMQRPVLDGGLLYPVFAALGLDYGPAFQGIVAVAQGEQQLLVELSLPAALRAGRSDWVLHPSLLDSALQASITLDADVLDGCGQPALPFALDSLQVLAACTDRMVAWVRPAAGSRAAAGLLKVDIDLCDADGQLCVRMRGFSSRPVTSGVAAVTARAGVAIDAAVAPD